MGAGKYLAEGKIFKERILNGGQPSLVYVYNAANAADRDAIPQFEDFGRRCGSGVCVTVVDVYKSDGLAKRLGVTSSPCTVYLAKGKAAKRTDGPITAESLAVLVD